MYVCMMSIYFASPQTLTMIIHVANSIVASIKPICTLIMFDGQTCL